MISCHWRTPNAHPERFTGIKHKHVRFKRTSTASRSSRIRASRPITQYLPTPRTILRLLILLLIPLSFVGFNHHLILYVNTAVKFSRSLIKTVSSLHTHSPDTRVPPHITEYVQRAISTALKTTPQHPDFALRSHRAIIVPTLTTYPMDGTCEIEDVLDEDLDPGSCCFFAGDHGQIAIRLSKLIRPLHVAVDYTPPIRSMSCHAPRQLVLWGLVDGAANKAIFKSLSLFRDQHRSLSDRPPQAGNFTFLPFANFTFDIHAAFPIQTFPIHLEVVFGGLSSGLFVLEIRSNWGGNSTGIRRVHLHGEQVS